MTRRENHLNLALFLIGDALILLSVIAWPLTSLVGLFVCATGTGAMLRACWRWWRI